MNNRTKLLVAGSVLMTVAAFDSQAVVIDNINLGTSSHLALQDISLESIVTTAGDVLTGVGHITSIDNNTGFATGVELNFTYSAKVAYDNGGIIIFNPGASLTFYVDPIGTYSAVANNSGTTTSSATTAITSVGTDFLDFTSQNVNSPAPYNAAQSTGGFFGTGSDLAGSNPDGSGVGYFDVTGGGTGVADGAIIKQQLSYSGGAPGGSTPFPYDLKFTSTFSVPGGNPALMPVQDASTFTSFIPEPGTIALLGLGLFAAASLSRRGQSA